jgi:hypothetical protein
LELSARDLRSDSQKAVADTLEANGESILGTNTRTMLRGKVAFHLNVAQKLFHGRTVCTRYLN